MQNRNYDLVVIGSGPAGIFAAVQAAKLGKKACVVEKDPEKVGGCWVHTGTLPSKTLRESLATIHSIRGHVGQVWVDRIVEDMNATKMLGRASQVASQEESLLHKHLQGNGIDLLQGYGLIENQHSVRIIPSGAEPYVVEAKYILIATGSQPRRPPEIPFDGWRVVDSDEVLYLETVPKELLIYGAGVVGCEYACIFAAAGTKVTIVDSRSRILQYLDVEVGNELQKSMESMGIEFVLGNAMTRVDTDGPRVVAHVGEQRLATDVLFFAAGRVSCSQRLSLEKVGIAVNDRGAIEVNDVFQTKIPNIYAAGDVIGPPALAATSFQQGRHVACHAFGVKLEPFPKLFPVGVYTIPELSMVGMTENEAKQAGLSYVVGRASYSEIARGYIRGDSHGLLKILVEKDTCRLLGIHIVGADACNLIHIGLAFMVTGGVAQDMINMVYNYPTLAEGYKIAAFNALNKLFPNGVIGKPVKVKETQKKKDKVAV